MNDIFIEQWLDWKMHNQGRSPATAGKYRRAIVRLTRFLAAEYGVDDLRLASREQLEQFTGIHLHREKVTIRARRPYISAVRGFYAWLLMRGQLEDDPAKHIKPPLSGMKLPNVPARDAVEKLLFAPDLSTFQGIRDLTIMITLIGTGMRVTGLCNLNMSNLNFGRDDDGKEVLIMKVKEKGGKERLIPAHDDIRYAMHAYRGHKELGLIDRYLKGGDQVLFVSTGNRTVPEHNYVGEHRRLSRKAIVEIIDKYARKAGVDDPGLHPHGFRHLFGTELAESGTNMSAIQALMGHASPSSTALYITLGVRALTHTVKTAGPLSKIRTPISALRHRLEGR